jgi:ferrous iron transport protein B
VFSTFGITSISATESTDEASERTSLRAALRHRYTPLSAYAFIVFVLLYMPCVIVAVAMRQEFGTWKWFGIAFAYQMILAWGMAFLVYQGGRFLGLGG